MEIIRNPKAALLSNPGGLGLVLAVVLCAAGAGYCASGNKGKLVQVSRHPGEVRGCSFLGRVTGAGTQESPITTGTLQRRVAEMGGDVLLLLPGGIGEAWSCGQATRAHGEPANPTPRRPIVGAIPTAPATPRT